MSPSTQGKEAMSEQTVTIELTRDELELAEQTIEGARNYYARERMTQTLCGPLAALRRRLRAALQHQESTPNG